MQGDSHEADNHIVRQCLDGQRLQLFLAVQSSQDDAALEVQAVLKSAHPGLLNYKRGQSMRAFEQRLTLKADVSLVDRRNGKVLFDNRPYVAETTFFSDTDIVTARRDASGRLAEDLARQIVDDVAGYKWNKGKE